MGRAKLAQPWRWGDRALVLQQTNNRAGGILPNLKTVHVKTFACRHSLGSRLNIYFLQLLHIGGVLPAESYFVVYPYLFSRFS